MNNEQQKLLYVSIVGAPNAGKSTLINKIVGQKIAIVTRKVQTTRDKIDGIFTENDTQIIFYDTPGIFRPKTKLEKSMVYTAWSATQDVDIVALLIDAKKSITDNLKMIIDNLKSKKTRSIAIINKIDLMKPEELALLAQKLAEFDLFEEIFLISGLKGKNVDNLMNYLKKQAAPFPWIYHPDEVTSAPLKFLASEITREKLFLRLSEELPYNLMVETEKWEELKNGDLKINQVIIVKSQGHKKIVLGKNGSIIKEVGERARKEISYIFDKKTHLFLFVKVKENWDVSINDRH